MNSREQRGTQSGQLPYQTPAAPRRNLSPAEKKARDKAVRQRVKEKKKAARQERKLEKREKRRCKKSGRESQRSGRSSATGRRPISPVDCPTVRLLAGSLIVRPAAAAGAGR